MLNPSADREVNHNYRLSTEKARQWWRNQAFESRKNIVIESDAVINDDELVEDQTVADIADKDYDELPDVTKQEVDAQIDDEEDVEEIFNVEGDEYLQCSTCDDLFTSNEDYDLHKSVDHGEEPEDFDESEETYQLTMHPELTRESLREANDLLRETKPTQLYSGYDKNGGVQSSVMPYNLPPVATGVYDDNPNEFFYSNKIFRAGSSSLRTSSLGEAKDRSMVENIWGLLVNSSRMQFLDEYMGDMNIPLMITMGEMSMPETNEEVADAIGVSKSEALKFISRWSYDNGITDQLYNESKANEDGYTTKDDPAICPNCNSDSFGYIMNGQRYEFEDVQSNGKVRCDTCGSEFTPRELVTIADGYYTEAKASEYTLEDLERVGNEWDNSSVAERKEIIIDTHNGYTEGHDDNIVKNWNELSNHTRTIITQGKSNESKASEDYGLFGDMYEEEDQAVMADGLADLQSMDNVYCKICGQDESDHRSEHPSSWGDMSHAGNPDMADQSNFGQITDHDFVLDENRLFESKASEKGEWDWLDKGADSKSVDYDKVKYEDDGVSDISVPNAEPKGADANEFLDNINFGLESIDYVYPTKANETKDKSYITESEAFEEEYEEFEDSDDEIIEETITQRKLTGYSDNSIARELHINYGVSHEEALEKVYSIEVSTNDKVAQTFFGKMYKECTESEKDELRMYSGSD